ncbi:hypothetical protein [Mesorhizobium sp. M1B.F.Ca.ET.045.04.1.1]|uniref:hypothetical protein n=1 Tax=Mesorhizobium sp. M1B.F.Ca.ET.045.04.1.1 TaxID=2493673 RepID=UPI000F75DAD4|nr:hypothetical protein [Mesorhizobium sp. M1B.F.Ca.ET.045.04.1.1]AZO29304.1 hypothetical protein EJ071_19245 [Mesorhizobium sp. M1B.F.Ca.ET.045.04.1.1]
MTDMEYLEAGVLAFMKVIDERIPDNYVAGLKADNADEYRMMCAAVSAAMEAGNKRRVQDLLEANNRYQQAGRNWTMLERFREGEGNSITLVCDNPDFNGQANSKVIVCADWTEFQEREFTGDTITQAIANAFAVFGETNG